MTVPNRWYGPGNSTRFHYFDADLRSLCRKWMLWADPVDRGREWGMAEGNATGDCADCKRRVEKMEAAP